MWFNKKPKFKLNSEWLGYTPKATQRAFEENLVRKIVTIPGELWVPSYFSEGERTPVFSGYQVVIAGSSDVQILQRSWSEKFGETHLYRIHVDGKLVAHHDLVLSSASYQLTVAQGSAGYRGIASVYEYIDAAWKQRTAPQREVEERKLAEETHKAAAQKAYEQNQSYNDILRKF